MTFESGFLHRKIQAYGIRVENPFLADGSDRAAFRGGHPFSTRFLGGGGPTDSVSQILR